MNVQSINNKASLQNNSINYKPAFSGKINCSFRTLRQDLFDAGVSKKHLDGVRDAILKARDTAIKAKFDLSVLTERTGEKSTRIKVMKGQEVLGEPINIAEGSSSTSCYGQHIEKELSDIFFETYA